MIGSKELVSDPAGPQKRYKCRGVLYMMYVLRTSCGAGLCGFKRITTSHFIEGKGTYERLSDLPGVTQLDGGGNRAPTTAVESH